jgi:hypothetical protein
MEASQCRTSWDDYKDAFEWFERQSERYTRVRLYREKTVIEADLLLSTY